MLQKRTGYDNVVDIIGGAPLTQVLVDSRGIIDIQVAALRFAKQPRVILNGIPFSWRVNDWKHLLDVILYQL